MSSPVAIITGAGRGIGRATAIELSQAGYRTALVARNLEELSTTASQAPGSLVAPADVSDSAAVNGVVERTLAAFGRIDAIVHCAGLAKLTAIDQLSDEQWRAMLDTNLSAAFYLTRAVWPSFVQQKQGVAVYVSSEAARDPFTGLAAYAASKAGLNAMGLSLAREGQAAGISVHVVAPGAVETKMLRSIVSRDMLSADRALDPADVARVIVRCVRGELRYASGETLYLNKMPPA